MVITVVSFGLNVRAPATNRNLAGSITRYISRPFYPVQCFIENLIHLCPLSKPGNELKAQTKIEDDPDQCNAYI